MCVCVCTYMYMYVYMYIHIHMCMCVCLCACVCVFVFVCVCVCVCVDIYYHSKLIHAHLFLGGLRHGERARDLCRAAAVNNAVVAYEVAYNTERIVNLCRATAPRYSVYLLYWYKRTCFTGTKVPSV